MSDLRSYAVCPVSVIRLSGRELRGGRASSTRGYGYMRTLIVLVALGLISLNASAAGESGYVTIVSTASASNLGNHVYIKVSSPPTTPASCSTHVTWHFSLSLDTAWGKNLYAMLLAAKAAGTTVWISGTNACSELANVESLRAMTTYE